MYLYVYACTYYSMEWLMAVGDRHTSMPLNVLAVRAVQCTLHCLILYIGRSGRDSETSEKRATTTTTTKNKRVRNVTRQKS